MAMNVWIVEIGNTRAKCAQFKSTDEPTSLRPQRVHAVEATDAQARKALVSFITENDPIMLTGSGDLAPWADALPQAWTWPSGGSIPFDTLVQQRETLGLDRIANVWAVLSGSIEEVDPNGNWMIADAGTCLTIDVVKRGVHLGGRISPGIQMRLTSMAQGTARLPRIDLSQAAEEFIAPSNQLGTNTTAALLAGAAAGMSAELLGTWTSLRQEVPNLGLVLTGGDASRLELQDIRPTFADAHLTLKGYHGLYDHAHRS